MIVETFRFQEYLMTILVGEPVNLVLDRRAITRTSASNRAGIDGRLLDILGNDRVGFQRRPCNAAFDLRHRNLIGQIRKRNRLLIGGLHFKTIPGDRPAIQPCRRTRLQTPHRETKPIEPVRQANRRGLADTTGRDTFRTYMDDAFQEGACGDHDRSRTIDLALQTNHARDVIVLHDQVFGAILNDGQVWIVREFRLHGVAVKLSVDLGAGAPDSRTLGPVEHSELDTGLVCQPSHEAVQRIDLSHEVTLAEAANCRITAHLSDGCALVCDQSGACARPRRGRGRFAAGMTAAYHYHIKLFHLAHGATSDPDFRKALYSGSLPQTLGVICRCRTGRTPHRAHLLRQPSPRPLQDAG